MLCGMFLYVNSEIDAQKLVLEIWEPFYDFIIDINIKENKQYWKIKEMYKVELQIKLNRDENQIRTSKEWYQFLRTISDKWEFPNIFSKDSFLTSEKMQGLKYIKKNVAFVDISIGNQL